jgi:hypothetical protein
MGMDAMNYLIRKAKTDNKRSFSMKEGKTLKEILAKSKLTEAATYFVVDTSTKQRKMVKDKLTKAEAEKLAKTNKNYKVSSYDSNPKTSDDWDDLYDSYQMDESKSYQVKYAKSKGDKIQVAEYDSEEDTLKMDKFGNYITDESNNAGADENGEEEQITLLTEDINRLIKETHANH